MIGPRLRLRDVAKPGDRGPQPYLNIISPTTRCHLHARMIYYACSTIRQMATRSIITPRTIHPLAIASNFTSSFSTLPRMDQFQYSCTIDAVPLHRYTKGGYHPITLGDFLDNGRYKILHKLGWGGYSTVWAARDKRLYKLLLIWLKATNLILEKGLMLRSRSALLRKRMIGSTENWKS